MSIGHDALHLDTQLRIRLGRNVDHTTRLLVQRWAEAWQTVAGVILFALGVLMAWIVAAS